MDVGEVKHRIMLAVLDEFFSIVVSHKVVIEKEEGFGRARELLAKIAEKEKPVFSDIVQAMNSYRDKWLDDEYLPKEFFRKLSHIDYRSCLDSGFSFSDRPEVFLEQFCDVYGSFAQSENDPKVDPAMMKTLYHAGQMIERLKHEGKEKSDKQSERGSRMSKKHIGEQAIYEAFYLVDWEGLKMIRIGELIRSYLLEREAKKPKSRQKKVYSGDYIAKKILPKDKKIKEILLREGILKK